MALTREQAKKEALKQAIDMQNQCERQYEETDIALLRQQVAQLNEFNNDLHEEVNKLKNELLNLYRQRG